ncbi:response regulator transcription factor [Paenibacillus donghaensis]|uniref:DNA-binding response regulator n=1 Tax=Paenibacillus donghaensis TaxID=414771 RepID=A0A2Z2KB89_9BACL|nr:response regulator transcription factor [Paenibacillus donghaensis]ASA22797.1 hypothetical protein B9T62_19525 [Paenibacillus donghaensis]
MKLLIAEDEADIRRLMRDTLEPRGHVVLEAKDGVAALELVLNHQPDLILLDVVMPRLDGFNLLRKLRKISHVPVIIVSARGEEMDKLLGLGLGADDYLPKPFSPAELAARVEAQLRRRLVYDCPPAAQRDRIQIGELLLDTKACTLHIGEHSVPLLAKEYKLLEWLMRNPERVFTRKKLYAEVWEDEYCYDDNTIMVTISRLRSKLEADPRNPRYLVTVRGLGYKFSDGSIAR